MFFIYLIHTLHSLSLDKIRRISGWKPVLDPSEENITVQILHIQIPETACAVPDEAGVARLTVGDWRTVTLLNCKKLPRIYAYFSLY